jgi:predicted  nucleic acid-binding Zn-ribbon protein
MELVSLTDLLDLQNLDLAIDRLLEQRQNLPELAAYKSLHDDLEKLEDKKESAATTLRQSELDLDKSDGELQMLEAKLNEHETRLFAGGMSGRETEHMRLEVQGLRGQREALEERVLQMLEDIEPERDEVESLEARIETMGGEKSTLEASIKNQWKKIDGELARKEDRKREAVGPIENDLMELYEKLRRIKEGVAVASYDHNVCGGCHMALSPAEHDEAFSTDLPRCVHCRRILVA